MKKIKLQQRILKLNKDRIADLQSKTIFGGVRGVGNIPTGICMKTNGCLSRTTSCVVCPVSDPTDMTS